MWCLRKQCIKQKFFFDGKIGRKEAIRGSSLARAFRHERTKNSSLWRWGQEIRGPGRDHKSGGMSLYPIGGCLTNEAGGRCPSFSERYGEEKAGGVAVLRDTRGGMDCRGGQGRGEGMSESGGVK